MIIAITLLALWALALGFQQYHITTAEEESE